MSLTLLAEFPRNYCLVLQLGLHCPAAVSSAWPRDISRRVLDHVYASGPSWFVTKLGFQVRVCFIKWNFSSHEGRGNFSVSLWNGAWYLLNFCVPVELRFIVPDGKCRPDLHCTFYCLFCFSHCFLMHSLTHWDLEIDRLHQYIIWRVNLLLMWQNKNAIFVLINHILRYFT